MNIALLSALSAEFLAQLDPGEGEAIRTLEARGDCKVMAVSEADKLLGYAVFGMDDGDLLTVYMARAITGMVARAAMLGIFGAAKIAKVPVRVHTEKVKAMARMMGAEFSFPAVDGDGVPMGVFHGQ